MVIPRDVMSMENFKRWDAGLPLEPEERRQKREEPSPPEVPNQLKFEDVPPEGEIRDIESRGRSVKRAVRNREGQIFVGHDVSVVVGEKTFSGWMAESDCLKLKKRIPPERVDLLRKISF